MYDLQLLVRGWYRILCNEERLCIIFIWFFLSQGFSSRLYDYAPVQSPLLPKHRLRGRWVMNWGQNKNNEPLVTVGAPNDFSRTTLRPKNAKNYFRSYNPCTELFYNSPLGPRVTFTLSCKIFTPDPIAALAPSPKRTGAETTPSKMDVTASMVEMAKRGDQRIVRLKGGICVKWIEYWDRPKKQLPFHQRLYTSSWLTILSHQHSGTEFGCNEMNREQRSQVFHGDCVEILVAH